MIGTGGQGDVYEAKSNRKRGKNYAIKVTEMREEQNRSGHFRAIVGLQKIWGGSENYILKVVAHEEVYIWLDDNNKLLKAEKAAKYEEQPFDTNVFLIQFIVMEKLESLVTVCNGKKYILSKLAQYDEDEILKLAYAIGTALNKLHNEKVLHRDVKIENIFYSPEEHRYYLGDFGVAEITSNGFSHGGGYTRGYAAPEIINEPWKKYDYTADIYSLGRVLYVLMNEFENSEYDEKGNYQYAIDYCLPNPQHGSERLVTIVRKMCQNNPDDRYQSMDEVVDELEELILGSEARYKRIHKNAYLGIGVIFALFGAAMWELSFMPLLQVSLPRAVYLLLILCVWKFFIGNNNTLQNRAFIIMLVIGIYLLINTGFSWWKLLQLLIVALSAGRISCIVGGGILMAKAVDLLIVNNLLLIDDGQECGWIAVTLLTLSAMWMIQYYAIKYRCADTTKITNRLMTQISVVKNIFLIMVCIYYAMDIAFGKVVEMCVRQYTHDSRNTLYEVLHNICQNIGIWDNVVRGDLQKIGIVGLSFALFWLLREFVLYRLEKK